MSWVELTSSERNWAIDIPMELIPRSSFVSLFPELSKDPGLKVPGKNKKSMNQKGTF